MEYLLQIKKHLEHRGTLDYILEQFLPKGLTKLDAPVREILRAALAQARYKIGRAHV